MKAALYDATHLPVPALRSQLDARKVGAADSNWTLLLLALALGAAAKFLCTGWIPALDLTGVSGISALFAALGAAIALHEGGHLVAAVSMGFDVLGLSLDPVRATRSHQKWTIRLSYRNLFGGSVSAIPRDTECWRARMLTVVAAGPAATLLTGIFAANLLPFTTEGEWTNAFLAALAQCSFLIFLLGLIPNSRHAKARNDARLIALLSRGTPEAREILLYHVVTQLQITGVRPRDYPEELMREFAGAGGRTDVMLFYAQAIALWAIDCGDGRSADAWDQRCTDLSHACDSRCRNAVVARSAFFDVLFRNDFGAARRKFADVAFDQVSPPWLMHRVRAACWLSHGNVSECLAEVCRARYAFPNRLPYYEFERMLLSRLHEKALALEPPDLASRCDRAA